MKEIGQRPAGAPDGDSMPNCTYTLGDVKRMGWLPPGRVKELRELVEPGKPWPPERAYVAGLLDAPHAISESCWCAPRVESVEASDDV